jgi:hypothetical protein
MSGETANIAEVAEKISKEIFSFFKWKNSGRYNENFPCHNPEIHSKSGGGGKSQFKAEHPCDCVFSYYDPYKNRVVYLLVDLKSYASGSIQKDRIRKALEGLAKSVDCAESSGDWQKTMFQMISHGVSMAYYLFIIMITVSIKILKGCWARLKRRACRWPRGKTYM